MEASTAADNLVEGSAIPNGSSLLDKVAEKLKSLESSPVETARTLADEVGGTIGDELVSHSETE